MSAIDNMALRRSRLSAEKQALLEQRLQGALKAAPTMPKITPLPPQTPLCSSFAEQRLWLLAQMDSDNLAYTMPAVYRLSGPLNVAALERSLREIVRRHQVLRTKFVAEDGVPVPVIMPTPDLNLPIADSQGVPEAEQEARLHQWIEQETLRPFDLAQGSLFRASLLRSSPQEHTLFLNMHHIVSDGWSIGVLWHELTALYTAFVAGLPSPLAELPIQYTDFAHWQRQWLQGQVLETQLAYWEKQLDNLTTLELPTDRPRPAMQTFRSASQRAYLDRSLAEDLKTQSQREGVTLFMTLLAAFKVLLYRHTGQTDIAIGSPISGRNYPEIERLIGFFINTLVLRTDLGGNLTFRELLRRVRDVALDAYSYQDLPFERLVQKLQPKRDLSRTPLFQVFFNMLNLESSSLSLPGLTVQVVVSPEIGSKFDLTLYAKEQQAGIEFKLVYNADLFTPAHMTELLGQFTQLLSQIAEKPDEHIAHFSLITPAAAARLPDPTRPLRSEWKRAIPTQFALQARRVPRQLAVMDKDDSWTYTELDQRSNQLAHCLLANSVQPQDVVAVYGHRSSSLVWALLGILKAGAAFMILDPAYPTPRLIDYLRVTKPRGWIHVTAAQPLPKALEECVAALPCKCHLQLPRRATAAAHDLLADYSTEEPAIEINPDDLAYLAFTSGTTGTPKGILGTHRPLSHFMEWHTQTFGLNEADRFSMLSGLAHDPLLRDIFAPLWSGATLCIPDVEDIQTPGGLAAWMQREQISITHLTPAMGQILAESTHGNTTVEDPSVLASLRYAFFGGDRLTKRDVARLAELAPSVTCVNFYGATETPQAMGYIRILIHNSSAHTEDMLLSKDTIPVGQGIEDVQLLVLNPFQQHAGIGELGEIYVRTPYLTRGYLDDEALTQERFIINPFTKATQDRLYRTGDLGRYLPDGAIEILGRADQQVKIRGFRIEPAEIEIALGQHPAVQDVVVIAREVTPGDRHLVAYVTSRQPAPTSSELRSFLKNELPDYMVPSAFVVLDNLPLTPNGKVDRRALPAPDLTRDMQTYYVAPRNAIEETLAEIWTQVLGHDRIGIHDNFFERGGHSLLATQLISRLNRALEIELTVRALFETPTIAGLAQHIETIRWALDNTQPRSANGQQEEGEL